MQEGLFCQGYNDPPRRGRFFIGKIISILQNNNATLNNFQ